MRVIAGSARGIPLKAPAGMDTRPTVDKVKEAVFGSLQFFLPGSRVLDLFAGSGALGIEALSRGAAAAVLVEKQAAAMAVIRQNLRAARCEAGATLLQMDYLAALSRLREPFSFIFLDPPYASGLLPEALARLAPQIDPGGTVVCESDRDQAPEEVGGLKLQRIYRYGRVYIWLYRKENGTDGPEGGDPI